MNTVNINRMIDVLEHLSDEEYDQNICVLDENNCGCLLAHCLHIIHNRDIKTYTGLSEDECFYLMGFSEDVRDVAEENEWPLFEDAGSQREQTLLRFKYVRDNLN